MNKNELKYFNSKDYRTLKQTLIEAVEPVSQKSITLIPIRMAAIRKTEYSKYW